MITPVKHDSVGRMVYRAWGWSATDSTALAQRTTDSTLQPKSNLWAIRSGLRSVAQERLCRLRCLNRSGALPCRSSLRHWKRCLPTRGICPPGGIA